MSLVRSGTEAPFDALVYAETNADDLLANGAFSVVRMAVWTNRTLAEELPDDSTPTLADQLIGLILKDVSDEEVDAGTVWGIPIEGRRTVIKSFEEDDPGEVPAHARELAAVEGLEVADRLSAMLRLLTLEYHGFERAHGRPPSFADMEDALRDE